MLWKNKTVEKRFPLQKNTNFLRSRSEIKELRGWLHVRVTSGHWNRRCELNIFFSRARTTNPAGDEMVWAGWTFVHKLLKHQWKHFISIHWSHLIALYFSCTVLILHLEKFIVFHEYCFVSCSLRKTQDVHVSYNVTLTGHRQTSQSVIRTFTFRRLKKKVKQDKCWQHQL